MGGSIFWISSGSCPLCLTPPLFELRAALPGGSFLCFSELETNFDEFSTCSDAEPVTGESIASHGHPRQTYRARSPWQTALPKD